MKTWTIAFASVGVFVQVHLAVGQTSFLFDNYLPRSGVDAPVFDSDGTPLFGTHFVAMLYGGPTANALAPARSTNPEFQMQPVPFTYMPDGLTGYFTRFGLVQFETVPCGELAWLQVRAWDLRLGATYEEVMALGQGGFGQSSLFQAYGGVECGLPTPPRPLVGLQSFSLVPEPSTVLLCLLAGIAATPLIRRASKRSGPSQQTPDRRS